MCLLAPGASAWSGEALSLLKNIPAGQALEREHHELSFLRCCRQSDVRQMFVDFSFTNADGLGDLPGGHLLLVQEVEDFLADGLRMALLAHRQSWKSESPRLCPVAFIVRLFSHSQSAPAISVISKA